MLARAQGGEDLRTLSWLGAAQRQPRLQQDPDFPRHVG